MARTMVLWAPDWPIVAMGGAASVPAVVLDKGAVLACSQAARAEGVRRGMRRRDAQSRCPELVLHERFEAAHVLGIAVIFVGLIFMDGRLVKWLRKAPA